MGSIMVRSCTRSERGRVMCDRMARYGDYRDAGAFSNVDPMPLHRDNRDIIDARGRINDPKASILGILSIDLRGEKRAMASWEDWGEFSARLYLLSGVE